MGPARTTAVQASWRLLPNCGAWLPIGRTCSKQLVQRTPGSLQARLVVFAKSGGVLAPKWLKTTQFWQCGASVSDRTAMFFSRPTSWVGFEQASMFSSQSYSRENRIPSAKKKEKGGAEAVTVEDEAAPSSEAIGSDSTSDVVSDDEEVDESWEEGIAPLDEVDIPLDGETEDGWEYEAEDEGPIELGDGGDGGGIRVGSTKWGKKALEYAEELLSYPEFAGKFKLYAFRAYDALEVVKLRLDKLEDTYGSPTMEEIQSFARAYNALLDEATERKELPIIETEVRGQECDDAIGVHMLRSNTFRCAELQQVGPTKGRGMGRIAS